MLLASPVSELAFLKGRCKYERSAMWCFLLGTQYTVILVVLVFLSEVCSLVRALLTSTLRVLS